MLTVIVMSAASGVFGTMFGGILGAAIKKNYDVILKAFAAGMMLSLVCADLLPEALSYSGAVTLSAGLFAGIALAELLEFSASKHEKLDIGGKTVKINNASGLTLFLVMALHNLPEGLAIGTSEVVSKGLSMTLAIAMHDIPEGVAVAAAFISGGMKKSKAVLLAGVSGVPTVIGAVIGWHLGNILPAWVAIALGLAAGAMLYVVFVEMLNTERHTKAAAFAAILGIIVAFFIINLI
jgi:ZIP family zinc transporter